MKPVLQPVERELSGKSIDRYVAILVAITDADGDEPGLLLRDFRPGCIRLDKEPKADRFGGQLGLELLEGLGPRRDALQCRGHRPGCDLQPLAVVSGFQTSVAQG